MSLGIGNILVQGHTAGGLSSSSAKNGVSVSGSQVVFGQDYSDPLNPAQLISNREVPMNAYSILYNFGSTSSKIKSQSSYAGDAQMMELVNTSNGATSQATAIWRNDASKTLAVGIVASTWTNYASNRYIDSGDGILICGDFLGITTYKPRYLIDPTNGIYTWSNSNSEKMRLSVAGNLLIGTATDSGYKCDIFGTLRNTLGAYFATSSGTVGIGTTTPSGSYKLDIAGDTRSSNFYAASGFIGQDFYYTGGTMRLHSTAGDMSFATSYNVRLLIKSTGEIGVNASSINASALFQIDTTTKGFLPPRMTTAQIKAISTPAAGLTAYSTDDLTLCFYDGTNWRKVSHSIL